MMQCNDPICLQCIGDEHLRDLLTDGAVHGKCSFCDSCRLTIPLRDLAAQIDSVYREYFAPGGEEKVFDGSGDDNGHYEQEGSSPTDIIQELAVIEPEVADAIVEILGDAEQRDVNDGAEPFYAPFSRYVERDSFYPWEQQSMWNEFCQGLKHRRRYFNDQDRRWLLAILKDLPRLQPSPILTLSPDDPGASIFRARRASSLEEAKQFRDHARSEVGPPPLEKAVAGRMNAHGISVFYGAFSEHVAVAEVRPFIGSVVVVAEFIVIKPLKVLDLTQFTRKFDSGSMFAPGYYDRVTQFRFLQHFLGEISRPIQPHEEALEYVATQAIAEYLAEELKLNGIVYPSAQLGGIGDDDNIDEGEPDSFPLKNIALFDANGLVESGETLSVGDDQDGDSEEPDIERLWRLSPTLFAESETKREPVLRYVDDSAKIVKITRINVDYKVQWWA